MKIAFSPCPNDTFLFDAAINQRIKTNFNYEPQYLDIDHLNKTLLAGTLDEKPELCKVSFALLPEILNDYIVLPVGAALGFDNGPKLVTQIGKKLPDFDGNVERIDSYLADKSVVYPGQQTTAFFLYRYFFGKPEAPHFALYNEIESQLNDFKVDVGLIIHETRFSLNEKGLQEVCDLGQLWQQKNDLPLPLGCLVMKRQLGVKVQKKVTEDLQLSLKHAFENPADSTNYMIQHSIEKDPEIVRSHVKLYVTGESMQISSTGKLAVEKLLGLEGSKFQNKWLLELR